MKKKVIRKILIVSSIICFFSQNASSKISGQVLFERKNIGITGFLYDVAFNSMRHSRDNNDKLKPLALSFHRTISQAGILLDKIVEGFDNKIFSQEPKIQKDFDAINASFSSYSSLSKMTKERLMLLRFQISAYQRYLNNYSDEEGKNFSQEEYDFMAILQKFNELLIADILKEQYLPLMEGPFDEWRDMNEKAMSFGLWAFMLSAGGSLAKSALQPNESEEQKFFINGEQVIDSLWFGAFCGLMGYSFATYFGIRRLQKK